MIADASVASLLDLVMLKIEAYADREDENDKEDFLKLCLLMKNRGLSLKCESEEVKRKVSEFMDVFYGEVVRVVRSLLRE